MSRVALLIGVSQYAAGLDPLPDAQTDVEAMQRVLQQPQAQFEWVQALCDRPLQAMQEAMELFFTQRASDDQVVCLFCGYTLQAADGRLYFATPSTQWDEAGTIVQAQTMPARFMQDVMNNSPAKQQVLILDTYNRSPKQPVVADGSSVADQLGGDGRVILAANGSPYPTPTAIDAWGYTRYLAEGIASGSADMDDDGSLTAADLHHYATQKLQVAAPGQSPQLYGSTETARIPLLTVLHDDPQVRYRKVLEAAAIADTVDASGLPLLESRSLLHDVGESLGVSPQDAAALEAAVLRPVHEYRRRVELYQAQVADHAQSHDVASPPIRQTLKQLQQTLCLSDQDVALRTIAPTLAVKQRQQVHYQGNLAQYRQVLLGAMQRQFPLREGDRAMLHRLQQTLGLKDDDVNTVEAEITTQAEQFLAANGVLPTTESVEPPITASQPLDRSPSSPVPTPNPSPPPEAPVPGAPEDSRARSVVIQHLLNMTEPPRPADRSSTPEPDPLAKPVREEAPVLSGAQTALETKRWNASNYQALIIPAILLAAIVGLVAAVLSSGNRPAWFNGSWFQFGQPPIDLKAAQLSEAEGLKKAREGYPKEAIADYDQAIRNNPNGATAYVNRGVARHKLGDPGAAIKDYEQALKLAPNDALLHSNLSHAYYDRQDNDKALAEGTEAVKLNPRLAQARINLANARAKKGDPAALSDYTQAIALPSTAEIKAGAYNNRGNVQFAGNKIREAIGDYTQAITLNPNYADAYYNRGLAQAKGNRIAAITDLRRAAALYQQQQKEDLQKEATDRANALQKGN